MIDFKISKLPPPVYERAKAKFGLRDFSAGLVFAYYPYIHVYNGKLTSDIRAHEAVHLERQKAMGTEIWWEHYLNEDQFRLKEEIMAYRVQYKYVLKHYPKHHFFHLKFYAESLADPNIYGFRLLWPKQ